MPHVGSLFHSQQIDKSPTLSHERTLTPGIHVWAGIELLEHQDLVDVVLAEIVPFVPLLMQNKHIGPYIISANSVCFNQIRRVHRAAVTDGQRPVLHRMSKRSPDTRILSVQVDGLWDLMGYNFRILTRPWRR